MDKKTIQIEAVSTKNMGLKSQDGDWYNFGSEDSQYDKETMRNFMGKIENGDLVIMSLNEEGDFVKLNLDNTKKDFKKGNQVNSTSEKNKNINKNLALKCATELCKEDFNETLGKQDVIDLAKSFEQYLNNGS